MADSSPRYKDIRNKFDRQPLYLFVLHVEFISCKMHIFDEKTSKINYIPECISTASF